MIAIKLSFILGCFFIAQCFSSDTHHPVGVKGKCPEIDSPKDFNPQRMLGKWYSIEETGKEVSCVFYYFEETRPNHYQGHFYPANITIDLTPVNSENIGEGYVLSVENFPPLDNAVMKVIASDYDNYAVVFTCKEYEDIFYPHSAIWSRLNSLSSEHLLQAMSVVEKSFSKDHQPTLKKVDHENCLY